MIFAEANQGLSSDAKCYIAEAYAQNTVRAYRSDLKRFADWGGSIPCSPLVMANYLAENAERIAYATLKRWSAAIAKAHIEAGHPNPLQDELVQQTLRGIGRTFGSGQVKAHPLRRDMIERMLGQADRTLAWKRDAALIVIGYLGALRRSELRGLDADDIAVSSDRIKVRIRRSKTDQFSQGRMISINGKLLSSGRLLKDWFEAAAICFGPAFRPVDRHQNVSAKALSGEAISAIVKKRVKNVENERSFSGHSLRAGRLTDLAADGASHIELMRLSGHKSLGTLLNYVR